MIFSRLSTLCNFLALALEPLNPPESHLPVRPGQTHLNPNRERPLQDGAYLFPTDWNLCLSTRKPEPCQSYKEQFVKNISDGCFKS